VGPNKLREGKVNTLVVTSKEGRPNSWISSGYGVTNCQELKLDEYKEGDSIQHMEL